MAHARNPKATAGTRRWGAPAVIIVLACAVPAAFMTGTASASSMSASSAKAKITADWKAFFSSKTPASEKVKLVQDGSQFAQVIKEQASSPMAQGVSASVSKVTLDKAMTGAAVVYTISIDGKAALANQKGSAVLQSGTWKVGASSFCSLLALEGSAGKIPVCSSKS
ncbi:MAG TPA: hypothetical protein VL984_17650 [Acidimicrobiales bacterium]|nr:hypothetical protein [Acidimicrobiales bacterium]